MAPLERNNYFKLVAFIVDIACHVVWKYIKEKVVGSQTFSSFLDIREEKHKLVHVYETSRCCECVSEKIRGERHISKQQLLLLYKSDQTKQTKNHQKYVGGKMTQICICNYSAIENIDINVVDITLANYIIQKCGKHELGVDNWIEQIKDVRNEIFHLSDIQEITNEKFSRKWMKLEGSILGIANLIDSAYEEETTKKILQTKKNIIIPDYMLKYEILCREYWRNKCAEFERVQMQEIEKKATALQYKMPLVGGSTETNYKRTLKKIETLNTMVDKINILTEVFCKKDNLEMLDVTELVNEEKQRVFVPVFLQLDVPKSWEKIKIFEVIDEMRLKRTSDMNIRIKAISTDDFNILAEIANTLLHNVNELRSEVNQMMSTVLSEAAIVTSQPEQVCVNIQILDKAESEPLKSNFQFAVEQRRKFQVNLSTSKVLGCFVISNQLLFGAAFNSSLPVYDMDGNYIRHIKLPRVPQFISVISNNDVAVSYMHVRGIEIININTGQVKHWIVTSGTTGGISYQNELIYVVIDQQKIDVMNLKGEILRSFHCPLKSSVQCLSTDTDSLFFSDPLKNIVYCCDLNGSEKWKFTDDKMIKPWGVTTDGNGNLYVICYESNNVVVISPDGKHHKELLTWENGLRKPTGIYYDKSNDVMLVCNGGNCDAFLFDVYNSTNNE